jgi:hypothetical protein
MFWCYLSCCLREETVKCQETDLVLFISYNICLPENIWEKINKTYFWCLDVRGLGNCHLDILYSI